MKREGISSGYIFFGCFSGFTGSLLKYKKFFQSETFLFFFLISKSSLLNFFNLRTTNFCFLKYKEKIFLRKYKNFFHNGFAVFIIFWVWSEKCTRYPYNLVLMRYLICICEIFVESLGKQANTTFLKQKKKKWKKKT